MTQYGSRAVGSVIPQGHGVVVSAETEPIRDRDGVCRPLSVFTQACIETVEPGHTLRAAVHQVTENPRGSLLVSHMENMVRSVTETDLVRNGLAENTAVPSTRRARFEPYDLGQRPAMVWARR